MSERTVGLPEHVISANELPQTESERLMRTICTGSTGDIVPQLEAQLKSNASISPNELKVLILRVDQFAEKHPQGIKDKIPQAAFDFLNQEQRAELHSTGTLSQTTEKEAELLTQYIFHLFAKVDLDGQKDIIKWATPFLFDITGVFPQSSEGSDNTKTGQKQFGEELLQAIINSNHATELISEINNYVYAHTGSVKYCSPAVFHRLNLEDPLQRNVNKCVVELTSGSVRNATLMAISTLTDEKQQRFLLGLDVDRHSLSSTLDKVRSMIHAKETGSVERIQLERMGKILLGLEPNDPRTFYSSLEELYANVNFSEYKTNHEATGREVALMRDALYSLGKDQLTVAEIGCGTGRLPNELVKEDQLIAKIIGIDPSEENLRKAREADATKKVNYQTGTWTDPQLADESMDAIICLGRTLTHARDEEDLQAAFKTFERALKPGGVCIIDMPNPNVGVYKENRKKYMRVMQQLGIPIGTEDEYVNNYGLHAYHVIDSPDGEKSLYDRYVPDLEKPYWIIPPGGKVIDLKKRLGNTLDIRRIATAPIEGWEGAENVYYIIRKANNLEQVA